MEPFICQNDAEIVLQKVKEYLASGKVIKDLCILHRNEQQIVFLLDETEVSEQVAKIWWDGYSSGLKAALE